MFNYYDHLSSKENINSLLDWLVIQFFYVHLRTIESNAQYDNL